MKALKKISVIIMVMGVFVIIGKMEQSDLYSMSVKESLRDVFMGCGILCFGKGLNLVSKAMEEGVKKAKRIPFVKRERTLLAEGYKRAV